MVWASQQHEEAKAQLEQEEPPHHCIDTPAPAQGQEVQVVEMRSDIGDAQQEGASGQGDVVRQQVFQEEGEEVTVEVTVEHLYQVHAHEPQEVLVACQLPEVLAQGDVACFLTTHWRLLFTHATIQVQARATPVPSGRFNLPLQ